MDDKPLPGPHRRKSDHELVLVVSGAVSVSSADLGAGGGLFIVTPSGVEMIDDRPTSGISCDLSTGRWLRAVTGIESTPHVSTIMEYRPGHRRAVRSLARLTDVHDVLCTRSRSLAVSSHDNAVVELGRPLRHTQLLVLPGAPDSWQLNCLEEVDGEIFASARRRGSHLGASGRLDVSGVVFSLRTGALVAEGLSTPHSPRRVDGRWLICNTTRRELIEIDPGDPGRIARRVELRGWTRGLAVDDDACFVGVSGAHHAAQRATSFIAVVDRASFSLIDRIEVPCAEIYDLRLVPRWTVDALCSVGPDHLLHDFAWAPRTAIGSTTRRLRTSLDTRAVVRAKFPRVVRSGQYFHVPVTVTNTTNRSWTADDARRVHLAYRWQDESGVTPISLRGEEPIHTRVVPDVAAGASTSAFVHVRAPACSGRFTLCITLATEEAAVDPTDVAGADCAEVRVVRPRTGRRGATPQRARETARGVSGGRAGDQARAEPILQLVQRRIPPADA
jgi:hypothetical protein